ncbi:MAG: RrF2 family transcriptional regulator [Gemmatimonadota bacterium]|jgi:Rrf2 family nitric oxide-sensitive transcriptional repressor|nr:Rrf2 family transcriptional regulator [Gemmatimonadota bacterium]
MRLTRFTDNGLRCLIYLGLSDTDPTPAGHIAQMMGMSEDHLVKVVQRLAALGYVRTLRGRGGGIRLARLPEAINIGEVVRATEDNLQLASCFDPEHNDCPIASACLLSCALDSALRAFFAELDRLTLADLLRPRRALSQLIEQQALSA